MPQMPPPQLDTRLNKVKGKTLMKRLSKPFREMLKVYHW